jgi:hypothetical protein
MHRNKPVGRRRQEQPAVKTSMVSGSPIDAEATRAAYLERFGTLLRADPSDDEKPDFWVLLFQATTQPGAPFIYASFGAPHGEVFLVSLIPSYGFADAVVEAARTKPSDLSLPSLLRVRSRWTQFRGLLAVPMEDGSFEVRGADGLSRPVRRVVPITMDERVIAASAPLEILRRVRASGAMIADPLRACIVKPDPTNGFFMIGAPANVRHLRCAREDAARALAELRAQGASRETLEEHERNASRIRLALGHYEARLPPVPNEADLHALMTTGPMDDRYASAVRIAVGRGIELIWRDLGDDPLLMWFEELLSVVLATHPDARPILQAVVNGQKIPPARPPMAVPGAVETFLKHVFDAADMIAGFHPEHRKADLTERARAGIARPLDPDDPEHQDKALIVNIVWGRCVGEMYDVIFPPSDKRWRNLRQAFRLALNRSILMARQAEGATPFEKLVGMSEYVAFFLVLGYAFCVSYDDEDRSRRVLH